MRTFLQSYGNVIRKAINPMQKKIHNVAAVIGQKFFLTNQWMMGLQNFAVVPVVVLLAKRDSVC